MSVNIQTKDYTPLPIAGSMEVIDDLYNDSKTAALSANQGRILNKEIDIRIKDYAVNGYYSDYYVCQTSGGLTLYLHYQDYNLLSLDNILTPDMMNGSYLKGSWGPDIEIDKMTPMFIVFPDEKRFESIQVDFWDTETDYVTVSDLTRKTIKDAIPTQLSELSEDNNHRLVTKDEKNKINTVNNFIGSEDININFEQIHLSGGNITNNYTFLLTEDTKNKINNKQDKLTPGDNITITNNIISAIIPKSGTTDYIELSNKPTINNVELTGNKSLTDLGLPSSYAPTDAEKNIIVGIQKNGTNLTVDSNRKVNITVPTQASDIGAMASTVTHLSGDVPTTRKVNNKALSTDITLTASDVGARASDWTPSKSDIGLGNVGNFKAVSTVASQGLTDTEKSNARANIGAGTSSFSGNYNDLTNKPTIPTVNNATLTIQKNGTNVTTFTANASSNATANITVPTKVSELTNDSGYKTTDTNTTYTFATGDSNGQIKVTPSGGTAQNISVKGLGSLAYSSATIPTITDTYSATSSNGMSGKAVASAISGKQNTLATQTAYSAKGSATKVPQITTNSLGQVTGITEVTIEGGSAIRSFSSMADYQAHASEINEGDYFTIDDSEKPNVYSTTPVRIGTWIDGKGVYRVVVEGTTPSNNGTLLRIPDDNLGEILTMYGSILGKDSNTAMIGYSYSAYCSPYRVGRTNEVRINVSVNNLIGCPFRCVVEYIGLV